MRDREVARAIVRARRAEIEKGRYYLHTDAGVKYNHYYDFAGAHWYGFYRGRDFYWTRHHANRWWWWDARYTRWVFWRNGYWWWRNPAGIAYVYVDNNYYPYGAAAGAATAKTPEAQPPADAAPPVLTKDASWTSPDGSRAIWTAAGGGAFLYDRSGAEPIFLKYLGSGVRKVRFSGGMDDKALRIIIEFSDGTYALFDALGQSLDTELASTESSDLPGSPPIMAPSSEEVPPPPNPSVQPQ